MNPILRKLNLSMTMKNNLKNVVITGGAGFIGSNLAKKFLSEGAEKILIIDDLSTGNKDNLIGLNNINVRFVKKYSNIRKEIKKAVTSYAKDVRKKKFPLKKHSY